MKKQFLSKTVLILFLTIGLSFSGFAQIKVDPSNNVLVGQHWGQNALKEFDVRGEMFISHTPRTGATGWSYVGGYFTNHSYQVGATTVYRPIFEPAYCLIEYDFRKVPAIAF